MRFVLCSLVPVAEEFLHLPLLHLKVDEFFPNGSDELQICELVMKENRRDAGPVPHDVPEPFCDEHLSIAHQRILLLENANCAIVEKVQKEPAEQLDMF